MNTKLMKVLCLACAVLLTVFCTKKEPVVNVTGVSLNKTALALTEGESEVKVLRGFG